LVLELKKTPWVAGEQRRLRAKREGGKTKKIKKKRYNTKKRGGEVDELTPKGWY